MASSGCKLVSCLNQKLATPSQPAVAGLGDGFGDFLGGDVRPFLSWDMLVFLGLVLDPVGTIVMGLVVLPYFASECLDLFKWGRFLDIGGFLSHLSVELFGIVPEDLVLPEEVRPFGVSPEFLCFGLDLLF